MWSDSNNADGVRPESVTVRLYADSVDTGLAFTLSAANKTDDNTWTLEATDLSLPATKAGHAISYVLVEDAVDGYTSSVTGDIATGFVVTNTHTVTPPPDPMMYTITYVLNGGSYNGSTDNIVETYPAGTGILIHEAPTREGYTFDYWKGSAYQPGDVYTVTEDHTFVAQWKANDEEAPKEEAPKEEETPKPDGGDVPGAGTNDKPSEPSAPPAATATSDGKTTGSAALANTGDHSTFSLASSGIALLGVSALALAYRCRKEW